MTLVKESPTIPPDLIEWQESKKFLTLPQKAKDKLAESDPVEWQRLIDLGNKIWGEWGTWFMNQEKDTEHPFIDGLYIKRWRGDQSVEYWIKIHENIGIRPASERKNYFPKLRKELGLDE